MCGAAQLAHGADDLGRCVLQGLAAAHHGVDEHVHIVVVVCGLGLAEEVALLDVECIALTFRAENDFNLSQMK